MMRHAQSRGNRLYRHGAIVLAELLFLRNKHPKDVNA